MFGKKVNPISESGLYKLVMRSDHHRLRLQDHSSLGTTRKVGATSLITSKQVQPVMKL